MPESEGRRRARVLVRTFGYAVVGGALAVALVGVIMGIPALTGLGLVVAAEETLEFAVVASVLRIERAPVSRRALPPRLMTACRGA
jgi:hypothetical protein